MLSLLILTVAFQLILGVPLEVRKRFLRTNDNLTAEALRQRLDELLLKIEMNNVAINRWKETNAEQNHVILTKLNQILDQVKLNSICNHIKY